MIQNTQIPSVVYVFLKKVITYESGALFFIAAPTGGLLTELSKVIFEIESRDLILPLLTSCITLMLYFVLFSVDFVTGLRASRHEAGNKRDFVQSAKLWRSFWKLFGVVLIVVTFTIFCLLLAIMRLDFWYSTFLYSIVIIMLMVILFEYHSIGENIKRRFGEKPGYFRFFDKITSTIEEGVISKLKNLLK